MRTQGTVDDWFSEQQLWRDEVAALRRVVLATGLDEALKWGQPAYTDNGRNIAMIGVLNACAVVSFLKGALVDDPQGLLETPGENSRSARYMRFASVDDVATKRPLLEALLRSAVEVERAGLRVEPLGDDIDYVGELQERLDADGAFREAFERLTPGRRRAYNLHFGQPKNASTRVSRIEANTERILAGKGLLDCVCGHSKRMPRCDGSHKHHA